MDVIDRHFAAENAHDVAATLATYTEDVIWDDVANPACPVRGKASTAAMYEGIMAALPNLPRASRPGLTARTCSARSSSTAATARGCRGGLGASR